MKELGESSPAVADGIAVEHGPIDRSVASAISHAISVRSVTGLGLRRAPLMLAAAGVLVASIVAFFVLRGRGDAPAVVSTAPPPTPSPTESAPAAPLPARSRPRPALQRHPCRPERTRVPRHPLSARPHRLRLCPALPRHSLHARALLPRRSLPRSRTAIVPPHRQRGARALSTGVPVKRRAIVASAAFVAFAGSTGDARAADTRQACVAAADLGQTQRDQGKLVEARESFVTCARDGCPTVVANQCAAWLVDINREIPTVSLRATDAAGKELTDVQVFVDGVVTVKSLDGRAVSINPGVHRMRFTHVGDPDVEQELVIHAGEKVRPVEVRVGSKPEAAVAVPPPLHEGSEGHGFRFPILAGVSFGVSAASFITMGALVGTTASDVNHLRATCAGSCSPSDVSSANTRIVVANVAMGLGIATAVAGAATLLVVNLTRSGDAEKDKSAAPTAAVRAGPGSLLLVGTF